MKNLLILLIFLSANSFLRAQAGSPADTIVYEDVDEDAEFPGGKGAILKYLSANLQFPEALYEEFPGKIFASFIVEKDGKISNVTTPRSSGDVALDREIIRMISAMPPWTPARIGGKPIRYRYSLPVYICF